MSENPPKKIEPFLEFLGIMFWSFVVSILLLVAYINLPKFGLSASDVNAYIVAAAWALLTAILTFTVTRRSDKACKASIEWAQRNSLLSIKNDVFSALGEHTTNFQVLRVPYNSTQLSAHTFVVGYNIIPNSIVGTSGKTPEGRRSVSVLSHNHIQDLLLSPNYMKHFFSIRKSFREAVRIIVVPPSVNMECMESFLELSYGAGVESFLVRKADFDELLYFLKLRGDLWSKVSDMIAGNAEISYSGCADSEKIRIRYVRPEKRGEYDIADNNLDRGHGGDFPPGCDELLIKAIELATTSLPKFDGTEKVEQIFGCHAHCSWLEEMKRLVQENCGA